MSPENKAKELVKKFLLPITTRYTEQDKEIGKRERSTAKACALICVEEIIKTHDHKDIIRVTGYRSPEVLEYWQSVKQQIELL